VIFSTKHITISWYFCARKVLLKSNVQIDPFFLLSLLSSIAYRIFVIGRGYRLGGGLVGGLLTKPVIRLLIKLLSRILIRLGSKLGIKLVIKLGFKPGGKLGKKLGSSHGGGLVSNLG
jgi:hypothetical protein